MSDVCILAHARTVLKCSALHGTEVLALCTFASRDACEQGRAAARSRKPAAEVTYAIVHGSGQEFSCARSCAADVGARSPRGARANYACSMHV